MSLEGRNLTLDYGRRRAVDSLTISVEAGQIVGLLGPNGAGKTSTFYMIVGLIKPVKGLVYLDGDDITRLPLAKRARRGIAYLPQEPSVFRELSVEENLHAVLEYHLKSKKAVRLRADELIAEMGLELVRKTPGRVLSGGERRRVEIARALATEPRYLLLDEPFAGIDPKQVAVLQEMIWALKNRGLGLLITDHNVHEMLEVVDTATIIHEGRILKSGQAHELVDDDAVRQHYLGERFKWEPPVARRTAAAEAVCKDLPA